MEAGRKCLYKQHLLPNDHIDSLVWVWETTNHWPSSHSLYHTLTKGKQHWELSQLEARGGLRRNALLFLPQSSSATLLHVSKHCCFHKKLKKPSPYGPLDSVDVNTFADSVNRDLCLDNVSVYQVETNGLHLCCFGESLSFHYVWRLGDCSLAWLQVCDKWPIEASSRYFCDTVSDSLASLGAAVKPFISYWENFFMSQRLTEPRLHSDPVYIYTYRDHADFQNVLCKLNRGNKSQRLLCLMLGFITFWLIFF